MLNTDKIPDLRETETSGQRLVIVSNREPFTVKVQGREMNLEKTPGGLVSALDPVLQQRGGLWICWEGVAKKVDEFDYASALDENEPVIDWEQVDLPYHIQSVALTEKEINHYYYGYANTRIWPLFHYFVSHCNFLDERDWPNYFSANQKFADAILHSTTDEDWVWVHDYHLMLVPNMVRQQAPAKKLAFFLHIPFPSVEVFRILPRRDTILRGLLGGDLIGFHVPEYVHHFMDAVEGLLEENEVAVDREKGQIHYQGRVIQVKDFPISIDFNHIHTLASTPRIIEEARVLRDKYPVSYIGISVGRLDYTKGILENLEAIRTFFEKYPKYLKQLTFIQIAAPTRTEVPAYQRMKEELDQAVGRINGALAQDNWVPIQYFYRSFSLEELLPYFHIADFAMITPLRDGMNLVAKEYCAAKTDESGALILSEFTGAAAEMKQAFFVNPFNVEGMADVLHAVLHFPDETKTARMQAMRSMIAHYDIHYWVRSFLGVFEDVIHHRQPVA